MTKLITPEFRGSFCNLMTPRAFDADKPAKYSMTIPIAADDQFWKDLDKAIEAAAMKKWGEIPRKMKTFIKDGDDEDPKYGWGGCLVITASNTQQPGILLKTESGTAEPVAEDDVRSGHYFRAAIRPYAYEYNKTKGVAISLDNVLRTREGEGFTGKTDASDDFSEFI